MWVILIFIRAIHIYCSMLSTLKYVYMKEIRNSRFTKSRYKIALRKMASHFELLIRNRL